MKQPSFLFALPLMLAIGCQSLDKRVYRECQKCGSLWASRTQKENEEIMITDEGESCRHRLKRMSFEEYKDVRREIFVGKKIRRERIVAEKDRTTFYVGEQSQESKN